MAVKNPDYLSIRQAANVLDISDRTIVRWYKWWESPDFEKPEGLELPEYVYRDKRKTKYFKVDDLQMFRIFADNIKSPEYAGCMSEFNAVYQWGKRGKRALGNKGMDYNEVRNKLS